MSVLPENIPDIDPIDNSDEYQHHVDTFNLAVEKTNAIQKGIQLLEELLGDLSDLDTVGINSIVESINSLKTELNNAVLGTGDLTQLDTDLKDNFVSSINELVASIQEAKDDIAENSSNIRAFPVSTTGITPIGGYLLVQADHASNPWTGTNFPNLSATVILNGGTTFVTNADGGVKTVNSGNWRFCGSFGDSALVLRIL